MREKLNEDFHAIACNRGKDDYRRSVLAYRL